MVKNIREFLCNVDQRKTAAYGKGLTLDHSMEQFDDRSQKMISLLMNEYGQFRSMRYSSLSYDYGPPDYEKNQITLTGDSFDRWFELLSDQPVEVSDGSTVRFAREDPKVGIHLQQQDNTAVLTVSTPCDYLFFGSRHSLYAYGGGCGHPL